MSKNSHARVYIGPSQSLIDQPVILLQVGLRSLFAIQVKCLHRPLDMSRHNRRRNRAGHKASSHFDFQLDNFERPVLRAELPDSMVLNPKHPRRNDLSARHWHNRYLAWQTREKRQTEERNKLKEEQKRIFGGDSQDGEEAEGLCGKMMDFFASMDYLEC